MAKVIAPTNSTPPCRTRHFDCKNIFSYSLAWTDAKRAYSEFQTAAHESATTIDTVALEGEREWELFRKSLNATGLRWTPSVDPAGDDNLACLSHETNIAGARRAKDKLASAPGAARTTPDRHRVAGRRAQQELRLRKNSQRM